MIARLPSAPAAPPLADAIAQGLSAAIEQGKLDLPVLSHVAAQLLTATTDEECDVKRLADLIHRDPSTAAHVLRIANSPLFRGRVPIVTLQQAVGRLGMITLRQIAVLISCQTRAFTVAGHEVQVQTLFRHSLAAAVFAQEIARLRRWNVEEAFLGGLMHDIGRPVLLQALIDLHNTSQVPFNDAASAVVIEKHHAHVGGMLAKSWSLSPRLVDVILRHHDPESAESPPAVQAAMIVALADDMAHFAVGPLEVDEPALRTHPLREPLNLYPDEFDRLLARRDEVVETVQAML